LTGQTKNDATRTEQGTEQVFQEKFLKPPTPKSSKLSTDREPATGEQLAPPGGQNLAPAGHAPGSTEHEAPALPRAEIAKRAAGLLAGLRGRKTDPPGGRAGRPPSGASTGPQEHADDG
jgi:hypothetical protein